MFKKRTIMMYGRTRSGKTSQIGELAKDLYKKTGLPTLLYSIDNGGIGPIYPLIELGIIILVGADNANPWVFLSKASRGEVRDVAGKWIKADLNKYAMVAIESFTGFGDVLMIDLAAQSATGTNIGGSANVSFSAKDEASGDVIKIGGSNMAHYNVTQTRLLDEFLRSQKLPVPYVMWTASASKEEDGNFGGKVIGPAGPGKALTAEIPRHCDLCFRIDCTPSKGPTLPEEHIIYLGNSVDANAGNAVSLGNTRVPMGADLPAQVKPASIVKVLELIEQAELKAKEAIQKELGSLKK